MEFRTKKTGALIMTLAIGLFAGTLASADGDNREGRERHSEFKSSKAVKSAESAIYKQECSSCHHLYQSWLLPARSWQAIIDESDKHFGDNLGLDDATRKELLDYLKANSSEKTSSRWAQRITSSSEGMTPKRIMDVPWIKKEHREVSPNVFKRPAVGSASNCLACHTKGAEGNYDEDFIKIPK
jgi:hypothetical protein